MKLSWGINAVLYEAVTPNTACLLWSKIETIKGRLAKAFDCLKRVLIAIISAYGFDSQSMNFSIGYPCERSHRTKINKADSNYLEIIFRIPQGSVLAPLQLNIDICDMFLGKCYITCHPDNNTPSRYGTDLNIVISKLVYCTIKLSNVLEKITWKLMVTNTIC